MLTVGVTRVGLYVCTRCELAITPGGNVVENGERTGHVTELVKPLVETDDGKPDGHGARRS